MHHWGERVRLPGLGGAVVCVVYKKQLDLEHHQDQGADNRIQKEENRHSASFHQR